MGKANTSATLEDEENFPNFGDQMFSSATETKASFVVGVGTTLAKNKWAFGVVISFEIAGVTFLTMAFSKSVGFGDPSKVFFCSNNLGANLLLFMAGYVVFMPLSHGQTWLFPCPL